MFRRKKDDIVFAPHASMDPIRRGGGGRGKFIPSAYLDVLIRTERENRKNYFASHESANAAANAFSPSLTTIIVSYRVREQNLPLASQR